MKLVCNRQMLCDILQPTTVYPVINEINFSRIMTMGNQKVSCHKYGIRTITTKSNFMPILKPTIQKQIIM